MNYGVIWFLLYPILGIAALCLSVPLIYAGVIGEAWWYFVPSVAAFWLLTLGCWYGGRQHKRQITVLQCIGLMLLAWLLFSLLGMIPYGLSGTLPWIDSWFESVSTVSTTGLIARPAIYQAMAPSLQLWHSVLAWVGGMQFLAFMVTLLPLVSPSLRLSAQTHSSVSFNAMVHPMLGRAGKVLLIYCCITIVAIISYGVIGCTFAGISVVDAVRQGLLTVSTTGGIGNLSMSSLPLEIASLIPLFLVCGNFLLYEQAVERRSLWPVLKNTEWLALVGSMVVWGGLVSWHLSYTGVTTPEQGIVQGFFHVLSFMSTSGVMAPEAAHWPELDRFVLIVISFGGASLASLSGGLRSMRLVILTKMVKNELRRTIHPHMVVSFTVNGRTIDTTTVSYVLAYFFLFMATFFVGSIILALAGIMPLQAMGLAVACLSSVGATATLLGVNDFLSLPAWLKLFSSFLMILGRLEIFAFFILIKSVLQSVHRPW